MFHARRTLVLWSIRSILTVCFISAAPASAQTRPATFDPARHMSIDQVRPGMKGFGLSVFQGTKIEQFSVEVVSILHNFNPQGDIFLIRCAGQNLEHTGPIAGMSGSPIYLYDASGKARLAGAFAYGWSLQKDPIAGVQPIQYMLELPTGAAADPTTQPAAPSAQQHSNSNGPVRWNLAEIMPWPGQEDAPSTYPFSAWNNARFNAPFHPADPGALKLQPLTTPLMSGGFDAQLLATLGPIFNAWGMHPLQGGGASSSPAGESKDRSDPTTLPLKLEPGSVLAVPLLTGDVNLTAIGTCTEVLGDRVYGFGHPFNNEGPVAWPMGTGQINTVIANLMSSFKIGALVKVTGTLHADAMVGIAGQIGAAPPTVPIDLDLVYADGSLNRHYHFDAAIHPKFTPLLASFALSAATTSARELPQYHTLQYDLQLQFANGQNIHVNNTAVNSGPAEVFYDVGVPMMAASDNPFQRVPITKISGTVRVIPQAREGTILSVNIPRLKFRPGETVRGYVTYRLFRSNESTLPFELTLPPDLAEGDYQLVVSDWQRFLRDEQAAEPFKFSAENINQVFDVLRDVTKIRRDALYLRLLRKPDGVAVGRTAMPHLPSSRQRILLQSGRSNMTVFVSSLVKTLNTDMVMNGAADFVITIDKHAKVEVAGRPPREETKPRHAEPGDAAKTSDPSAGKEPAPPKEPDPGKKPSGPLEPPDEN